LICWGILGLQMVKDYARFNSCQGCKSNLNFRFQNGNFMTLKDSNWSKFQFEEYWLVINEIGGE
jgi:hypothetical protein